MKTSELKPIYAEYVVHIEGETLLLSGKVRGIER